MILFLEFLRVFSGNLRNPEVPAIKSFEELKASIYLNILSG
jgi:hypothetical protein